MTIEFVFYDQLIVEANTNVTCCPFIICHVPLLAPESLGDLNDLKTVGFLVMSLDSDLNVQDVFLSHH